MKHVLDLSIMGTLFSVVEIWRNIPWKFPRNFLNVTCVLLLVKYATITWQYGCNNHIQRVKFLAILKRILQKYNTCISKTFWLSRRVLGVFRMSSYLIRHINYYQIGFNLLIYQASSSDKWLHGEAFTRWNKGDVLFL